VQPVYVARGSSRGEGEPRWHPAERGGAWGWGGGDASYITIVRPREHAALQPLTTESEESHLDVVGCAACERGMVLGVLGVELFMAIRAGDVARVNELGALGQYVNEQDQKGCTPLHLAASDGRDQVVRALLALGADLEAQDVKGARPLHVAAARGHLEVVRALELAGAELNAHTTDGATPRALSLRCGHPHVAEFLKAAARSRSTPATHWLPRRGRRWSGYPAHA
jgi:hypothetical protein